MAADESREPGSLPQFNTTGAANAAGEELTEAVTGSVDHNDVPKAGAVERTDEAGRQPLTGPGRVADQDDGGAGEPSTAEQNALDPDAEPGVHAESARASDPAASEDQGDQGAEDEGEPAGIAAATGPADRPQLTGAVIECECEQLILTSSPYVLSGGGFGPVARSTGWPYPVTSDASGGLGALTGFTQAADAPPSLSVHALPDGRRCILHKVPAGVDSSGRPGRVLVHALLPDPGTLHPRYALELPAETFVTEWLLSRHRDTELPRVAVRVGVPSPKPAADPTLPSCVAALLDFLDGSGPRLTLLAECPEQSAELLRQLFAVLPEALTASVGYSTFETGDDEGLAISTLVRGYHTDESQPGRCIIDLSAPVADWVGRFRSLAKELVETWRVGEPPPPVSSVDELRAWERGRTLLAAAPESLGVTEVEELLAGRDARHWLERYGQRAVEQAFRIARSRGGERVATKLAPLLSSSERRQLVEPLLHELPQRVLAREDVEADLGLVAAFTGSRPNLAEDVMARAIALLMDGRLPGSTAAWLAPRYPAEMARLRLDQQLRWLAIDSTPAEQVKLLDPWGFAFLTGHFLGYLRGPIAVEEWLDTDPDFVVRSMDHAMTGVPGLAPGAEPLTVLKVLKNVEGRLRAVALQAAMQVAAIPIADTMRALAPPELSRPEDQAVVMRIWPDIVRRIGLDPSAAECLRLVPATRRRRFSLPMKRLSLYLYLGSLGLCLLVVALAWWVAS